MIRKILQKIRENPYWMGAVLLFLVVVGFILWYPDFSWACGQEGGASISSPCLEPDFWSWAYWQKGTVNTTSRSEVLRNFVLLIGGVIALGLGYWRAKVADKQADAAHLQADAAHQQAVAAHQQTVVAEQGLITGRFSKAIEHLGKEDNVTIRLGGLYTLKRIAEDSPERDHRAVMDVLSNFIRRTPYADEQREIKEAWEAWEAGEAEKKKAEEEGWFIKGSLPALEAINCPDIVAAIKILQSRTSHQKEVEHIQEYRPTLLRADLSHLQLIDVDLHGLDLSDADLSGAHLNGANLTGAKLNGADLNWAKLNWAKLNGADLNWAKLIRAELIGAELIKAEFIDADLTRANLRGANFSGTNLSRANLSRAFIPTAENLTQKQLDSAFTDGGDPSSLPKGLKPPEPIVSLYF